MLLILPEMPRPLVEQLVYPRGGRWPTLFLADHPANRQQEPQLGVDGLDCRARRGQ